MAQPVQMQRPFSIIPLSAALIIGALLAIAAVAILAVALGRATTPQAALAAGLAAGSVLSAGLGSLAMILTGARSGSKNFGMFVATAGGVRMFISLSIALVLFFVATPEPHTFWGAFLGGSIVWLVIETAWAMRASKSMFPAARPNPSGAGGRASDGAIS